MQCSIEQCAGLHYSKGYCRKHYDKWRNHGDALGGWTESHAQSASCIFKMCTKKALSRGYCSTHYAKLRTSGELPLLSSGRCTVENCTQPYYGNDFCKPHYSKWYKHGDPLYIRKKAEPRHEKTLQGYIRIYNMHEHPNSDKKGSIFEHTMIMSEHLGRSLLPHENVHHKNGQRNDNSIENLELWSRSQPSGQRVEDKTAWAVEWLKQYSPELLKEV
jgi:hypothetical protein